MDRETEQELADTRPREKEMEKKMKREEWPSEEVNMKKKEKIRKISFITNIASLLTLSKSIGHPGPTSTSTPGFIMPEIGIKIKKK